MRSVFLAAATLLLSACGGGSGGGERPGPIAPPPTAQHSFANPTEAKTYQGIGGAHSYTYDTSADFDNPATPEIDGGQDNQLYAGNASTARNSGISIAYSPRDGIFELTVDEPLGNADTVLRFQDPAHRTDFGGAKQPQDHTPNFTADLPGINYLQAGTSSGIYGQDGYASDVTTFFFQKPGTSTQYVTLAGYLRNRLNIATENKPDPANPSQTADYLVYKNNLQRGAFAYGERTVNSAVPKSGSGTYNGSMIATLVYNPLIETDVNSPTYFQWMHGTAQTRVDFGKNSFEIDLDGTVMAPQLDNFTSGQADLPGGSKFHASGSGRIDLVHTGGFAGAFQEAYFTTPGATGVRKDVNIAGSSVDGAFFGPNAEEVGGGFRIVGGTPDERIDILGAFTGRK
ncbi:transferrin-binding protein-like solute binding protein [Allosphingosinicella vermicomposti]|uniref:transferrin-binding protein-like solute binding protein n=1 Tax=Allosphingosinicella vermicomposti TaxID=614671 RepID=UPI00131A5F28|nr:transferrin-binding protein-like solute binding protein [Allosphingosinicella vermicomposti]